VGIALEKSFKKSVSSGTLATLPLLSGFQTFFLYFCNALGTFAPKINFLA